MTGEIKKVNVFVRVAVVAFFLTQSAVAANYSIAKGDVDGLIAALAAHQSSSDVIELAPGDYQLREGDKVTDSIAGDSHLLVKNATVKGMGEHPEDTRIIGFGNCRVVYLNGGKVMNLTITNGYARKVADYKNSGRGGATYNGEIRDCILVGNRSDDYGGASSGTSFSIYNSRCLCNTSAYGGAMQSGNAYNSLFAFNTATEQGGAGYNVNIFYGCTIISNSARSCGAYWKCAQATNTLIACNRATENTGGPFLYAVDDGSSYDKCFACVISNNVAGVGYGGINASANGLAVVRNCTIVGNVSTNGSSAVTKCQVYDSRIERNCIRFCKTGGAATECVLSNCVVFANFSSNDVANITAPAVYKCTVYDSEIYGNCCAGIAGGTSVQGCAGGAHGSTLYDSYIHDNYSTLGAGVRECTAYGCRIANNVATSSGPNALGSNLIDCTVEGLGVYGGTALRTTFKNIGQPVSLTGNPYSNASRTSDRVIDNVANVTNCLFAFNRFAQNSGSIFYGTTASGSGGGHIVNCTIASNVVRHVFQECSAKTTNPCLVENTLVFGNGYFDAQAKYNVNDYGGQSCAPKGLMFSCCAFGDPGSWWNAAFIKDVVYQFDGTTSRSGVTVLSGALTPNFFLERNPEHPFDLQGSSAVLGKGLVQGWMSSASDIRGDRKHPRLRDGVVDIGCYQYRPIPGLILLFR